MDVITWGYAPPPPVHKSRVPARSGNHGKPGKSQKRFHAWKNHGI